MGLKVLVFSVSAGTGHDNVAKVIAKELKNRSQENQILIVDTFKYINSMLDKVLIGGYMETIKFTPKVYGFLYRQAEDGDGLMDFTQIFSKLLSPKLEQLLKEYKPDILVCTHAFPAVILATLKKKKSINIPIIACVTDYTIHSFWIHPNIDRYVIPQEDLKYPLVDEGIKPEAIRSFGIPIKSEFLELESKEIIRKTLGLVDQTTLLIMGGGLGLGDIENIVKKLVEQTSFQLLVVTGTNQQLKERLELLKENSRLQVFGFVDNVAQLMVAADLLITKPGGVTVAEALAAEVPIAIISSIPGQEERNTDYLLNKGVGIKIEKTDNIINELNSLFNNSLRMKQMKEMTAYLKKPAAAKMTVDLIFEMVSKGEDQCK